MKTAITVFLILAAVLCVFTIIVVLVDMLTKKRASKDMVHAKTVK